MSLPRPLTLPSSPPASGCTGILVYELCLCSSLLKNTCSPPPHFRCGCGQYLWGLTFSRTFTSALPFLQLLLPLQYYYDSLLMMRTCVTHSLQGGKIRYHTCFVFTFICMWHTDTPRTSSFLPGCVLMSVVAVVVAVYTGHNFYTNLPSEKPFATR